MRRLALASFALNDVEKGNVGGDEWEIGEWKIAGLRLHFPPFFPRLR